MRPVAPPVISGSLVAVLLGVAFGAVVFALAGMELRWQVYFGAAVIFLLLILATQNRERVLWGLMLLTLQLDVSVRLMHGHAGSAGIAFQLPVLVAVGVLLSEIMSGRLRDQQFAWGGALGWASLGLFTSMAISTLTSTENFAGVCALLQHAQLFLLYWLVVNGVRTEKRFQRVLFVLLVVLCTQSFIYYLQSALGITFSATGESREGGDLPRHGGTVATAPNGFTNFIMPLLFISSSLFLCGYRGWRNARWVVGLAGAMGAVALALTLTRAAWAAFLVGLFWIMFLGYRRRDVSVRMIGAVFALIGVMAIAFTPLMIARLNGAPMESSYTERYALMQMALAVIKAHPVLGVGPGAYAMTFQAYIPPEWAHAWRFTVHNHYLLRTAEAGIPGGIAWVALMITGIVMAVRLTKSRIATYRIFGYAASATLIAYAFTMYWDTWTFFAIHSMLWVMLGLIAAATSLDRSQRRQQTLIRAGEGA